jgi:hypothetical protein
MLANAAAPAILALAPLPAMLANAAAPAILALPPLPAMLANVAAPAILASGLQATVWTQRLRIIFRPDHRFPSPQNHFHSIGEMLYGN